MKHPVINAALLSLATLTVGCDTAIPTVSLGIDDSYAIARMQKLILNPALTGQAYRWSVDGQTVSTERNYIFLAEKEGNYSLTFEIIDNATPFRHDFTVNVVHEEVEYSAFISKVYEYKPAPGQFINEMPRYEEDDTYDDILQKVEESISGTNDVMISLGGFGGYVTFGFDHTVINVKGEPDFRIWGNAFYELSDPDAKGGSAEPGIVTVSYDTNGNGLPDDPWYELAGSAHRIPSARHGYSITYRRPDPDRVITGDESGFINDLNYIGWTDSEGVESWMPRNIFHSQPYYPQWVSDDTLTFTGTRLPDNARDTSGNGTYFVLYSFDWGYVDNHPNDYAELNSFDIGNAVDAFGNAVDLPGVDFIRVYTGLNQYCGWLGETSTELSRAQDLHISIY